MYFNCNCNVSKILALVVTLKFEMKESFTFYLWQVAYIHFVIRDSRAYHMRDEMTFPMHIKAIETIDSDKGRSGAVSRSGVCLIWFNL